MVQKRRNAQVLDMETENLVINVADEIESFRRRVFFVQIIKCVHFKGNYQKIVKMCGKYFMGCFCAL